MFQAALMVYLGIQFSIGKHGGGTHQWNVPYEDVQYNWRVSRARREAEWRIDTSLVQQLWRHDVQPSIVLHQTLHSLVDPEDFLFGPARPILLVDAILDCSKCYLLPPLPLHPHLSLLSKEQDMESQRPRPLF